MSPLKLCKWEKREVKYLMIEKNHQFRILCLTKLFFKSGGEIKAEILSEKQKLRKFVASEFAL